VLQRLGFETYSAKRGVLSAELGAPDGGGRGTAAAGTVRPGNEGGQAGEQRPKPRFPYVAWAQKVAEVQRLDLRAIELRWSEWHRWEDLQEDDRGGRGVQVPDGSPGVYEAKLEAEPARLVIGKASDLRARVKQGLVKGHRPHPAGAGIRTHEDLSQVRVRWAVTDRPAGAEEGLHRLHRRRFGKLPKYTGHT
jgi:hypothetical protein